MESIKHDLRPECAKEFGKIQAREEAHSDFRVEVRSELKSINDNMKTLPEIKELLSKHIGESGGGWQRIEKLEENQKELTEKHDSLKTGVWQDRVKTSGLTATLFMTAQFLLSHWLEG